MIISDGCLRYSYVPSNPNKYECTVCPFGYFSVKLAGEDILDYEFDDSLIGPFRVCVPSISAAKYGDLYRKTPLKNIDEDPIYVPVTCLTVDPATGTLVNRYD